MFKLISIVLTHYFQFNELKILRQPGYLLFEVKLSIFFYTLLVQTHYSFDILISTCYCCFLHI